MMPRVALPSPESEQVRPQSARIYTIGTLRYNQQHLFVLFFWLMWNDFSVTLMEQIVSLNNILMKDHGATFTQIALLGSIGGFITPWINPWVSTWSDRHRGRHGRRRPFLFWSTPFFAFSLMTIPFMPDFYHFLLRHHSAAVLLNHLPMNGEVVFIGAGVFIASLFNASLLAIFSYLYWDVVPERLMGRFQSLSKNVSLIAGLIWSFFILGLADHHMKAVYVGTGFFCLMVYLVSTWQIKEGEYPPPDPHKKGGAFAPIRAYFVECFSQPYYLWVFIASFLYQLGNAGNWYQFNYVHYDLKMDLATVGWTQGCSNAATTGFGLIFGFAIGSLTDRLKPVRLIGPCYVVLAAVMLGSFFFVHDKWTYLTWSCAKGVVIFTLAVVGGAFTVEIFPREKLGQFCSAQAVFYQVILNTINPFIAMLFDHAKDNRLSFLWTAVFYFLSAMAYMKVHVNWKKRHGQTPVPHAG
jgi:maltose/moltooligosaccharide transporter